MDSESLYRMYMREIKSEMKNIDDSLETLGRYWEEIDMDKNLNQDDKDDLFSEIRDFLKTL